VSDLFDEPPREEPSSHQEAVSPPATDSDEKPAVPLALRWRAATAGFVIAVAAALVMHFPPWAVAVAALLAAAMCLCPMPQRVAPIRTVVLASFFFAQLTSVFVNTPFTWPMRFGFSAVLISVPFVLVGRDLD
jgi:hypothetical protein